MPKTNVRSRRRAQVLVYTESPANGGIVFADPERAAYVANLHHAIETARTWGEFRSLIPVSEYESLMEVWDEAGDDRPMESEVFSSEQVPGYCDGDYPPWLQQEMGNVVPTEILDEFASTTSTMLNGNYWHIDPSHLGRMVERLREVRILVRDGTDIGPWH